MAIMTLRSVVKRLGNGSTYNNKIAIMPGAHRTVAVDNYKRQEVQYTRSVAPGFTIPHAFDNHSCGIKTALPEPPLMLVPLQRGIASSVGFPVLINPVDHPIAIDAARYAVEDFNKQKNARLQFVRVVMATSQLNYNRRFYYSTLEAIDAGVVKVYQAIVSNSLVKGTLTTKMFGLVMGNGSLSKLIDIRVAPEKLMGCKRGFRRTLIWDHLLKGEPTYPFNCVMEASFEEVTLRTLHKLPPQ